MKKSEIYKLLALTAIVSILISVGAFTLMKDNFIGPQGLQGESIVGPIGPQGEPGESIVGSQGVEGLAGEPGEQGLQGLQGLKGPVGFYMTYYPVGEYEEVQGIDEDNWWKQGMGGTGETCDLYQYPSGTFMMQTIETSSNQGLAFTVEPYGARLEIQYEGQVLFYGDFRNDTSDRIEVVLSFGPLVGRHDLYFYVLSGKQDGSRVVLTDITLVEFKIG